MPIDRAIDRASKREPVPVLRMVRMVLLAMGGLGHPERKRA